MTPQLQQAIRLLQLSSLELTVEVQQVLESNMMLEVAEEGELDTEQESDQETERDAADAEQESADLGDETAELLSTSVEVAAADGTPDEIPEDLPVDSDWDDIYETIGAGTTSAPAEASNYEVADYTSVAETLRDHILWQLNLTPMSETDSAVAMAIVDALNSDGYLTVTLEEIKETVEANSEQSFELSEIETVLTQIQMLEPLGVGARDLRECLTLQLAQVPADSAWHAESCTLVAEHLDLLAIHDYQQLVRRMKVSKEDLREIVDVIQALNPRPGSHLDSQHIEYVIPDVFVRKHKGKWVVTLNGEALPRLRVNKNYSDMIRRADDSADNNSLKSHLQEARWFIKSLQSRSDTLLRVATSIVGRQRDCLEHGEEAMKPLVLHDIADELGLHESTISRVTTRKYMHTPRGIYELKYFFSSHVSTALGGEAASTAIRAVIKKLIAEENTVKPLTDSKIAAVLADQGIQVARRTVAKYREAMAIPPSNERKRLA